MIFTPTPLAGAFVVELEKISDERGFFARTFCRQAFAQQGLNPCLVQGNLCYTRYRGTVRGLHYQRAPHAEVKLLRCVAGSVYDVIVDLRPDSKTHLGWFGVELSSDNRKMLYVPEGFANGYQSLIDHSEVIYQVSQFYHPAAEAGIRWNDPLFGIRWPVTEKTIVSEKDRRWNDFNPDGN